MLAGRDGHYYVLESNANSWTVLFQHDAPIATLAPPVVGDTVVFVDVAGNLVCYALLACTPRWSAPWLHGRRDQAPVALSPQGFLAVGSDKGRISAFDSEGRLLWSKVVAKRIETELAWVDDQTLVAGTTNSIIAVWPLLQWGPRA